MLWRDNWRAKNIGKNLLTAAVGQIFVEAGHFRETAAEYDDLWIEYVDNAGQCPAEPVFVAAQAGFAGRVTGTGAAVDLLGRQGLAGVAEMIGSQRRTGKIGFDTALTPAVHARPDEQ